MITDINSEDRLVQTTIASHLEQELGWENVYAWNQETFGPDGTLGRADAREVVLKRDLRNAITQLNPELPEKAIEEAVTKLTYHDFSRSLQQHNQAFYKMIRDGVPVSYKEPDGTLRHVQARVIDFRSGTTNGKPNNRFVAVRELKITGLRSPNYNRRADLVCFVNGLPLVFIELKAVYRNIRAGFDGNLQDYLDEHVIVHAFHHNAFLIVSNGHRARYGSITSQWEQFAEWKRLDEGDKGGLDAEILLNGMLAKERLLDIVENFILFDASKPGATRKVVARNHQVMGVNNAVAAARRQEELKLQIPMEERLTYRVIELCSCGMTSTRPIGNGCASRDLLQELQALLAPLEQWTQKEQTQAEVETFILDQLFMMLPSPPFTDTDKQIAAQEVYSFIWQRGALSACMPSGKFT